MKPAADARGGRIHPGDPPYDTARFYQKLPNWSIHGKDVWDTIRAVDLLQTLDFVDAEADRMCNARRYERLPERVDTRAGHYKRKLHAGARQVTLRMPRLRTAPVETQTIERYRRRVSTCCW